MSDYIPRPPKPAPSVQSQIRVSLGGAMHPLLVPTLITIAACKKSLAKEGPEALPLMMARVEIEQTKRDLEEAVKTFEAAMDVAAEAVTKLMSVTQEAAARLPDDLKNVIGSVCAEGARRMAGGGKGMVAS